MDIKISQNYPTVIWEKSLLGSPRDYLYTKSAAVFWRTQHIKNRRSKTLLKYLQYKAGKMYVT